MSSQSQYNSTPLGPNQLLESLEYIIPHYLVPYIEGPPGVGKSDIVRQFAKKFKLFLIDIRLSQIAPEDLSGFPMRNQEGNKAQYVPFDTFPLKGEAIPEGYNGWLIFLDELSSASKSVQAASYKILLDRLVGQQPLHENCFVVAAGNRISDGAIANKIGTAQQSRMIHLELGINSNDWLEWADKNNIDYRIKSYIKRNPSDLHVFDPRHNDKTFRCPRTWEFLSKIISKYKDVSTKNYSLLATASGTISSAGAVEFLKYASIFETLPSFEDILEEPEKTNLPYNSDEQFATVYYVGQYTTKDNFDTVMKYISRMNPEMQTTFIRLLGRKDPSFSMLKSFTNISLELFRFQDGRKSSFG